MMLLTNPSSRAVEHTAPGTDIAPALGRRRKPAGNAVEDCSLGVRHDGENTTVRAANTSNTLGAAVGVVWVGHGRLKGGVIDVADRREVLFHKILGGDRRARGERGATFAVSNGDGEGGAIHAVQEDGGRRWVWVGNADHADTSFVLLAGVALEAGPVLGTGDQLLETGQELTSVADTESECVRTFKEGLEFLAGVLVQKH